MSDPTAGSSVRALSLWRPWPWLILHAGKNIENRTWSTRYRGLLLLHAGKTIDRRALVVQPALPGLGELGRAGVLDLGYVGVAELVDVHAASTCRTRESLCSPWAAAEGWHWQLANPRAFPAPIAGPGRQRLFAPPQQVIEAAATACTLVNGQPQ